MGQVQNMLNLNEGVNTNLFNHPLGRFNSRLVLPAEAIPSFESAKGGCCTVAGRKRGRLLATSSESTNSSSLETTLLGNDGNPGKAKLSSRSSVSF